MLKYLIVIVLLWSIIAMVGCTNTTDKHIRVCKEYHTEKALRLVGKVVVPRKVRSCVRYGMAPNPNYIPRRK